MGLFDSRFIPNTPLHPDCPHCLEARRLRLSEDKHASARYMASHRRCLACGVLVGPSHYDERLDERRRCGDCERADYKVPRHLAS